MRALTLICSLGVCSLLILISCADEPTPQRPIADLGAPDLGTQDQPDDGALPSTSDASPDLSEQDMDPLPTPVEDCDPLVPEQCAMPWPSNLYLAKDPTRATGYTLTFGPTSLPRNRSKNYIDPQPFKRLDGYGLGSALHVIFPDVDISAMADEQHIERSLEPDSQTLWFTRLNDGTIKRIPHWVELDARTADAQKQTLFIRPAVILEPGAQHIVALRQLKDTKGAALPSSEAFELLRQGATSTRPALAARQARFDEIFALLKQEGVELATLTLAWDFVTASTQALTQDMLTMRDDALDKVGELGPELIVEEVKVYELPSSDSELPKHEHIALQIRGHFQAPHYLRDREPRGSILNVDDQGRPLSDGTRTVPFIIRVPHAAFEGKRMGIITYGHGLFGSRDEIKADHIGKLANRYGYIILATDLYGMAAEDSPFAQDAALDLTNFITVGDRLHQGLIEYLLLARAARGRLQAVMDEATTQAVSVDPQSLYYFGGSQGGIFGQTYMALSTDVQRGYLAVPGNNYALMLDRSVNFKQFEDVLKLTYPDAPSRRLLMSILQLHWDRTDGLSYMRHIKDQPLPKTPSHDVILAASKGDYQVAVVTNEIASRSMLQIPILGTYDREREPWGVPTASYPHQGSGLVLWDFGNPWPLTRANLPPEDAFGDPHPRQAEVDRIGLQLDTFFKDGTIIDICQGGPCIFPSSID